VPAVYVATGIPSAADYQANPWVVLLGAAVFAVALWIFRISHKALGRNWSITLEIRQQHELVCAGPYALVRHPMYTSFLLIALAQALLLSNWVVGLAGLLGFAILFVLRVREEERMMLAAFGAHYIAYMERTKRIIPYLY
jgi:protein-S-isoprenylcysteine O-methyltransferase Ste14